MLASRLGFILLTAGCAIGLGNIWRFPYICGQYGGAIFVLMYLFFLVLLGFSVMDARDSSTWSAATSVSRIRNVRFRGKSPECCSFPAISSF